MESLCKIVGLSKLILALDQRQSVRCADVIYSDLIFSVPKLVSFISQGTTLQPGTIILTGTPAGVGFTKKPPLSLREGDEFRVEIMPHIGTLVNKFVNE